MTGRPRQFDENTVLEAALQAFWEKGFDGTSKRDLMKVTGMSSQSLYNTFGDKRSLYEKALQRYTETRLGAMIDVLEGSGSPIERLRELIRSWKELAVDDEFRHGCLLCNASVEFGRDDAELTTFVETQMERMRCAYRTTLDHAQAAGEIDKSIDTDAVAAAIVSTGNGMTLMVRLGMPDETIMSAVDGLLGFIERL